MRDVWVNGVVSTERLLRQMEPNFEVVMLLSLTMHTHPINTKHVAAWERGSELAIGLPFDHEMNPCDHKGVGRSTDILSTRTLASLIETIQSSLLQQSRPAHRRLHLIPGQS